MVANESAAATGADDFGVARFVSLFAPVNTMPTFVGANTTLATYLNAGATDLRSLLHVSDSDSGQTLTWSQNTAPSHGTLSFSSATASSGSTDITPGGTITYTPASGYTGTDSFSVQVSDGTASATRTISVTVDSATASAGSSSPASIVNSQPSGTLTWVIALQGIFPSTGGGSALSDAFLGEVRPISCDPALLNSSWVPCAGQILPIAQNAALFSLLGTTYGGNGVTTFALPDLRGRVPVGAGSGPGLSTRALGATGGQESYVVSSNNLSVHNHTYAGGNTTLAGGGAAIDNMQPWLALNFCVLSSGLFDEMAWVRVFAFNLIPSGHAAADGATLPISSNPALFSLLSTTFGGNGTTTFQLPDLRARTPIGTGTGNGLTARSLGEQGGSESIVLGVPELTAHTHTYGAGQTGSTGGGQPHDTMQPFLALNVNISLFGVFGNMSQDVPAVGEVRLSARVSRPNGWLASDGSAQSISENETLFQLIGTTYGGDGESTFNLPALSGRAIAATGQPAGGSNHLLGETWGAETQTMSLGQLPVHTHDFAQPNAAPTDIALTGSSVNQSAGTDAVVGTLSSTDTDSSTFTYSLVSGTGSTDNSQFNISGVTLRANNATAMAAGDYSVRIQTDDGAGGTYAEAFTITVVDDVAPVAQEDNYSTPEDTQLVIFTTLGVLGNDSDGTNPNLTAAIVIEPAHGVLTFNSDGSFTFTPATNYNGSDSFAYQASDGTFLSSTTTVSLAISPVNDLPEAVANSYTISEDSPLIVAAPGVLANDSDLDGDTLTTVLATAPASGFLSFNNDGSFNYNPFMNRNGTDSFTYMVSDGTSLSAPATVSITINPVNDAPSIDGKFNLTVNEDASVTVPVPVTDPENDPSTLEVATAPAHGTVTFTGSDMQYTPETNYYGFDTFTMRASDGQLLGEPVSVRVMVQSINDTPVTASDSYTTAEDTQISIAAPGLLANDSDVESTLTAMLVSNPANGSLTLNTDGSFTYTPDADFHGTDGFAYAAADGSDISEETSVTITISSVNDTPVAALPIAGQSGIYGSSFSFAFEADTFTDVDGDVLSYSATGLPPGVSFDGSTRTFVGTPNSAGSYLVQIVASDEQDPALTATNEFTIAVAKAPLTITADEKSRAYGTTNPELTFAYSGFVLGDDAGALDSLPTISTEATSASPVGSYPITLTGASDDNYEITLVNSSLAVAKGALVVTADPQTRIYGAANPTLTGTLSSVVNGDNLTASFTTTATSASPVGSYDIAPLFNDPDGRLGNYTVTTNLGTLTITRAVLIVTADNQSRAYGQPNPTLTMSYSGFVNSDTAASLTTAPSCATTATETSLLGSYSIVPSGAVSENYSISYENGTLTITKAPLLVLGDDAWRPYGQTNPVFTAVITGVMNGDNITARFSTTADLLSPPEEYRIALNVNDPDGKLGQYNVTLKTGTLTVTPADLIGTVASVSRIYGQANPAFTVTYSGLMNGEDTSVLSGSLVFSCADTNGTATDTNSPVGSYPIEVISGQTAANYAVQYVPGTMTVTVAELIVSADNASRTYGAANPALTGSLVGVQNNDDVTATFATAATPASNIGNYDIGPVFSDPAGKLGNYTITTNLGNLTVSEAALTVTADNQTRLYGQANPALTGTVVGIQNDDNLGVDYTTEAGLLSAAGAYPITPVFGNPDGKLANYSVSTTAGTLTVSPAPLTGTVNNTSRAYGDANPDFTVNYTGFVNREDSSIVTGALTFSCLDTNGAAVDTNSPVGIFPISVTAGQIAPNYSISYVGGELTVTQAVLTATADNKGRAFGETNPVFTAAIAGYKNGEDASVLGGELAFACVADATSAIGDYAITPSGLSADNYSISYVDGTLTVGRAVIVVTADPQTRTYGDANPTLTASYSGFVNGEDASVLSGSPALSTTADNSSPVGDYTITAAQGSLSAANYAFSFVDGSLAITRKALTVAGDDASRIYGDANPAFTASYSGFVNGEDVAALGGTLSLTSLAETGSPVGTYAIVPAGLTSANYDIAFVNGTLTVNLAKLFVAAENQSRVYGAANPTLTGTLNGVVNSDNLTATYTTAATSASPVGTYDITPLFSDPDGKLGNYSVTTNLGTLTISRAALIVTADNQSRAYGQPNPPLTMSYSGFVSGDTAASLTTAPSCATTATTTSTLGGYPIVPSGAVSENYTISYVNGTLMVTKATLLVLGDNASRPYGQANPAFTAVITGIVNGDNIAPIFSTEATATSVPRRYDIEIWLNDPDSKLGQYDVTMIGGQLTVTRATLIGTVQNQTRQYGENNAPFSLSYSGFANGEDASILTGSLAYGCQNGGAPVNSGSPVGEYAISVTTGQTAANYTVQYVNGTLAITPAALTVTGNDASRVYGVANPTLTASITGFVNSEDASVLGGTLAVNTTATAASPVGSYPVTPSGLTSANYAIAYVEGALAVTQAELAGKVDDVSRGYGDTNPVFTVSYTGFVNGDDSSVVSGPITFSCVDTDDVDVDTNTPVGIYPIQVVVEQTASNYNITYSDGALTVTQAVLTVAADDLSRSYGTDNPEFTATITGFKNGEDENALDDELEFTCPADASSPVGTYRIEPSGLTSDNYAITFVNGTMTVGKVTVIATADNKSRIYGEANPELTISYSGFVDGEDAGVLDTLPVVSTAATATSSVGEYLITLTGGSDENYDITLVDGTLTIGQATIIATADNKSRAYGEANPQLTVSYTGFANSEDSTVLDTLPAAATTASATSPIGDYAITLGGGSDGNYNITLVDGTLAIGKAALTIAANDASRSHGQINPTFTGTITGLVNSDPISGSYDSAATPTSPAGTYSIVTTLVDATGVSSNYNVTLVNGTLTVTADDPPVITLTQTPGFYTIGTDAVLVDTNALVTDGASLDFASGTLTVTIVSNSAVSDILAIASEGSGAGQIGVLGADVTFGGTAFGTLSGGDGTNALVFSLNTNATPVVVQALLRRLTFSTFDIETASRAIEFVLADGDGGVSAPASRVLELNRPPVANDEAISASEGINATIAASLLLANDTDVDNDTITVLDYSAVTANGGRVSYDGTNFTYRAPAGFIGEDLFAYLIEDGRGGEAVGILSINVLAKDRLVLDVSALTSGQPDAAAKLTMGGTPGQRYQVQVSRNLVDWTALTTVVASPAGYIEVFDAEAAQHWKRFYRAVAE